MIVGRCTSGAPSIAAWSAGGPATVAVGSAGTAAGALPLACGTISPARANEVAMLKRLLTTARTSIWNSVPVHATDGTATVSATGPLRIALVSQRTGLMIPWNTDVSTSPDVGVTVSDSDWAAASRMRKIRRSLRLIERSPAGMMLMKSKPGSLEILPALSFTQTNEYATPTVSGSLAGTLKLPSAAAAGSALKLQISSTQRRWMLL